MRLQHAVAKRVDLDRHAPLVVCQHLGRLFLHSLQILAQPSDLPHRRSKALLHRRAPRAFPLEGRHQRLHPIAAAAGRALPLCCARGVRFRERIGGREHAFARSHLQPVLPGRQTQEAALQVVKPRLGPIPVLFDARDDWRNRLQRPCRCHDVRSRPAHHHHGGLPVPTGLRPFPPVFHRGAVVFGGRMSRVA